MAAKEGDHAIERVSNIDDVTELFNDLSQVIQDMIDSIEHDTGHVENGSAQQVLSYQTTSRQKKPTRLYNDIYHLIIEKWIQQNFDAVDSYEFFRLMFINKFFSTEFLRLFAKIISLRVIYQHEIVSTYLGPLENSPEISKWLYAFLFMKKLPISVVFHFLSHWQFSNNFLSLMFPDEASISANGSRMEFLDSAQANVYFEENVNWRNLEAILALNVHVICIFINVKTNLDDENQQQSISGAVAPNVLIVSFSVEFYQNWTAPFDFALLHAAQWRALLLHVVRACPNAKLFLISFDSITFDTSRFFEFMLAMQDMLDWFITSVLPVLIDNCTMQLSFRFAISDAIYHLLLSDMVSELTCTIMDANKLIIFFHIVDPIVDWLQAEMLPKMRRECVLKIYFELQPACRDEARKYLHKKVRSLANSLDFSLDEEWDSARGTKYLKMFNESRTFEIFWYY